MIGITVMTGNIATAVPPATWGAIPGGLIVTGSMILVPTPLTSHLGETDEKETMDCHFRHANGRYARRDNVHPRTQARQERPGDRGYDQGTANPG